MQSAENDYSPALARKVPPAPGGRSAHHMLLFGTGRAVARKWWVVVGLVLLAVAAVVWLLLTHFDWAAVSEAIARLDAIPLVVAMCALPLVGFPILPVYLVAGARFGPGMGGIIVTIATSAHLVGTYIIARTVLRRPLERLLVRWHAHLPEIPRDEEAMVSLIAALVPGLPYVVRNYLLAMAGLRLRVYFWICLPVYVARSYVSILLGDMSDNPSRNRFIVLGAVELVKVVICGIVIWRLRVHHRRFHGASPADVPRPPIA